MIWIGLAIVVVTFYLIYKNYEARLVLALSGLVMAFIGQVVVGTNGGVSAAVDAFVKQLVNGGLSDHCYRDGFRLRHDFYQMFRPFGKSSG